jgi:hypothetical protein
VHYFVGHVSEEERGEKVKTMEEEEANKDRAKGQ